MRSTIERWLAQSVEPVDASSVALEAEARWERDSWRLEMKLESASGLSRDRLSAAVCETLVEVIGLKVALAANVAAAMAALHVLAPAPESQLGTAVRVASALVVGRFPEMSPSFQLVGALEVVGVRFELGVSYVPRLVA